MISCLSATQRCPADGAGRRDATPIVDHRLLHPFEVHAIVDMTHMVDVGRFDRNRVAERGQWTWSFAVKLTLSSIYNDVNKSVN